ncbi:uncharacterized protein Z520_01812 [Fonsecaea multimorphosa CBS 102226]|uniref:Uncharacterized protein n=1 Tax=Fonsecaea multimorphosa CBS 102226 TaxID=1442371 RepID=A0A0D2KEB3_9EURO|nr:uncharacterized protein Z520_01812 [Fonsecaea multimorphosa CBS 102226]KIY01675.1 hypothetical protein Z520_01812 [Fonsecaea multimorphosa CBS 102226]OAL29870.1 hypothetical protein AYO22_01776 [Fonsecaea multimorphosa]
MSTSGPSTETASTIPIPPSLTSSTTSLPPATSQALIQHLRQTGAIPDLSSLLADSLARTGWTDRVRALALELLRNGSCDTFPELMSEVMRRAKLPKDAKEKESKDAKTNGTSTPATTTTTGPGAGGPAALNGAVVNSNNAIALSKEWSGGPDGLPDVRIPEVTVELGVEFLKEKIKDVVEPIDDDSD